jgi:nitrogen fixation/metabolism regulation signal transduction histidine kinase
VKSLRTRLIAIFLAATLAPLAATWWITTSLLEQSLAYSSTDRLDRVSRSMEQAGREVYQQTGDRLKHDVEAHKLPPRIYRHAAAGSWPAEVRAFWESGNVERFAASGDGRNLMLYLVRKPDGVWGYSRPLPVDLARFSDEYRQAREEVDRASGRDLRRGFVSTFVLLAAAVWVVSFALLALMAHRISRPIRQLTEGLDRLASGDLSVRLEPAGGDEAGRAIRAFNGMAARLSENRDRLVYLTQLASWQLLARKMAHELKNSLTPIRLTMEEALARNAGDRFLQQAARIVVDEVESLERRIRAFSEFAAEPPVEQEPVAVNDAVEERIAFLNTGHPEVAYSTRLEPAGPVAFADPALLNGILTNLLENAAEAAGAGGSVLAMTWTSLEDGQVVIEVHDSGPGLSDQARKSLFEPSISFKKRGMGLGLSIARKNALLMGGDIASIPGALEGAGFRVSLPQLTGPQLSAIGKVRAGASVSPQGTPHPPEHLIADS